MNNSSHLKDEIQQEEDEDEDEESKTKMDKEVKLFLEKLFDVVVLEKFCSIITGNHLLPPSLKYLKKKTKCNQQKYRNQ
jgi:hypothetical protein